MIAGGVIHYHCHAGLHLRRGRGLEDGPGREDHEDKRDDEPRQWVHEDEASASALFRRGRARISTLLGRQRLDNPAVGDKAPALAACAQLFHLGREAPKVGNFCFDLRQMVDGNPVNASAVVPRIRGEAQKLTNLIEGETVIAAPVPAE